MSEETAGTVEAGRDPEAAEASASWQVSKALQRKLWIGAFVGMILLMTAVRPFLRYVPPPPPDFGAFPEQMGLTLQGEEAPIVRPDGRIHLIYVVPDEASLAMPAEFASHAQGVVGLGAGHIGGVVPWAPDRVMRKVSIVLQQMEDGSADIRGVYTEGQGAVDRMPLAVSLTTVYPLGETKAVRQRIAQGDTGLAHWSHLQVDAAGYAQLQATLAAVADRTPELTPRRRLDPAVERPQPEASILVVDGAGRMRGLFAVDHPEVVHELVHRIGHIRQQAAAAGRLSAG